MGMESPCQKREIRPLAEADIEAYLAVSYTHLTLPTILLV